MSTNSPPLVRLPEYEPLRSGDHRRRMEELLSLSENDPDILLMPRGVSPDSVRNVRAIVYNHLHDVSAATTSHQLDMAAGNGSYQLVFMLAADSLKGRVHPAVPGLESYNFVDTERKLIASNKILPFVIDGFLERLHLGSNLGQQLPTVVRRPIESLQEPYQHLAAGGSLDIDYCNSLTGVVNKILARDSLGEHDQEDRSNDQKDRSNLSRVRMLSTAYCPEMSEGVRTRIRSDLQNMLHGYTRRVSDHPPPPNYRNV